MGVVGGLVLLLGIILIPYPGPGWATVIAGLAILASEFSWAKRALGMVKHYYYVWTAWLGRQPRWVQGIFVLLTSAVVLVTLWLLGTFALIGGWFGVEQDWLSSPLLG